jgi:hypothetical protein
MAFSLKTADYNAQNQIEEHSHFMLNACLNSWDTTSADEYFCNTVKSISSLRVRLRTWPHTYTITMWKRRDGPRWPLCPPYCHRAHEEEHTTPGISILLGPAYKLKRLVSQAPIPLLWRQDWIIKKSGYFGSSCNNLH